MRSERGPIVAYRARESRNRRGGPRSGARRRALGRVTLAPLLDLLPEVLGELGVLVAREERGDFALDRLAGARRAEELPGDLVEVGEVALAELLEALGLEALVRDRGVGRE